MAEYIEREAVHNLVRSLTKYTWTSPVRNERRVTVDADEVQFGVDKVPATDVAPVRHGRWLKQYRSGITVDEGYVSSCCDMWDWRKSDYCPSCGAKMDLED